VAVPTAMALAAIIVTNGYQAILVLPMVASVALAAAFYSNRKSAEKKRRRDMEKLSDALGILDSNISERGMPLVPISKMQYIS